MVPFSVFPIKYTKIFPFYPPIDYLLSNLIALYVEFTE